MQKTKGFTLIELLVVIAIIGILSGLIIVSMSGATNAAKDARVQAAMDQLRSTAEVFKLGAGNYGTLSLVGITTSPCVSSGTSAFIDIAGTAGADGLALCNDIQAQGSGALTIYSSNSTTTPRWCAMKVMPSSASKTWCIDNAGHVGSTSVSCDGTNFDCI